MILIFIATLADYFHAPGRDIYDFIGHPFTAFHRISGPLPTTAALDELVAENLAGIEPRAYALLELLAPHVPEDLRS